ncbi:hypothetical protein EG19_05205 [Thermoanaerobaculum aquaticum]|uniref:Methyltransferase FkbM domain-containing protein n=1 Tax=Thermoanaerobaculum aquaticum TaxID=1312852 RepID=A0A062XYK7_9BACT|nr:FkbM family methyltransferase [Thermoanaerobaculum aquaticum]KDA53600.1 hypothetical protein EG19_05205 [Thermoanaerobaculum aquaticum]
MDFGKTRLRLWLLEGLSLLLRGRSLDSFERAGLKVQLPLGGFRQAARWLLLRDFGGEKPGFDSVALVVPVLQGKFRLALAPDDWSVSGSILEHRFWEPEVTAFLAATVQPGWTVLDVGANVGFHTFHAATLVGPSGLVYAVEPDPRNAVLLRLTAALAPELRVTVIEAALSDRDGEIVLMEPGEAGRTGIGVTHHDGQVLEKAAKTAGARFTKVPALCWDRHFQDVPLHLVKIDVEGYEPFVVRGMEQSLVRWQPIVVTEFAPSHLQHVGGIEPLSYLQWFQERGFRLFLIDDPSGTLIPADAETVMRSLHGRPGVNLAFLPNS